MFLDPADNRVLDFVGGFDDLHKRRIRAIGDPRARMREDKLRLLRAMRFTATLDFELDLETSAAVREMAHDLVIVSAERISQELRKMLVHASRARAIELCREHGLLAVILPELATHVEVARIHNAEDWPTALRRLAGLTDPAFELAMAALLATMLGPASPDVFPAAMFQSINARLRLSNAESERITWLLAHFGQLDEFPGMTPAQAKWLAVHMGIEELLALERSRVAAADGNPTFVESFADFLDTTPLDVINPPPLLTGGDLIRHGLKPSRQFGVLLEAVRDAQLNETISNRDEALALVERLQN